MGRRSRDLAQRQRDPETHLGVVVFGQRQHPPEQRPGAAETGLGELHGVSPDARRRIRKSLEQVGLLQRPESIQGPEGVHSGQRLLTLLQEPGQMGRRRPVLAFEDEPVGRFPPPAPRVLQVTDQFRRRGFPQTRPRRHLEAVRFQTVDPAMVLSPGEVQMLDHAGRDVGRLDQLPVHVQNVERSIGCIDRVHGAKPVVGGTDHLHLLRLAPHRSEAHAVLLQDSPVQQVGGVGADEEASPVLLGKSVTPVDLHPGAGGLVVVSHARASIAPPGEDAAGFPDGPPELDGTDLVDPGRTPHQRVHLQGAVSFPVEAVQVEEQVGVALQVAAGHDHVPARRPRGADVAVVPVVETVSELEGLGGQLQFAAHRVEPEVPIVDGDGLGLRLVPRPDVPSVAARRSVDLVVDAPDQVVHHLLLVGDAESGEDDFLDVRLAVAVGVLHVVDVGRSGDVDPLLPDGDAGGPDQPLGKDVAHVEAAVSVPVLQQPDLSAGLFAFSRLVRVVPQLGHVHASVLVEGRRHRLVHHGFVSHQLQPESFRRLERLQGFCRRRGRDLLQVLLEGGFVPGDVHDPLVTFFGGLFRCRTAGRRQRQAQDGQDPAEQRPIHSFHVRNHP